MTGAERRDQAVDDLLVVAQLVFGALRRLHHSAQERDPADVIPRDLLLLAALEQRGVLDVVIGERLEGGVHRLVARLDVVRPVEEHRADPADHRHDRLLGIDGARQLDELPGRAQLDHVGDLKEGELGRILLGSRVPGITMAFS